MARSLRGRPAHALCLLQGPRRAASQLRQADRGDQPGREREACRDQGRAEANGVEGMRFLSAAEAIAMEPNLQCTAPCSRPAPASSTAIPTCWRCRATPKPRRDVRLQQSGEERRVVDGGVEIEVGGTEPMNLRCRLLINAAGLHAPGLAKKIVGMPSEHIPTAYYAKGNYFTLTGRSPFSRLSTRCPCRAARCAHHRRHGRPGQVRPDVEWIDSIEYSVDPIAPTSSMPPCASTGRRSRTAPCSRAMPASRPKIVPQGAPAQDFTITGPAEHAVTGLINLFGIESPGLITASLALAEQVRDLAALHDVGAPRPHCRTSRPARRLLSCRAPEHDSPHARLQARRRHSLRQPSAPEARRLNARTAARGRQVGHLLLWRLLGFRVPRATICSSARRWPLAALPPSFPTIVSIPSALTRPSSTMARPPRPGRQAEWERTSCFDAGHSAAPTSRS